MFDVAQHFDLTFVCVCVVRGLTTELRFLDNFKFIVVKLCDVVKYKYVKSKSGGVGL